MQESQAVTIANKIEELLKSLQEAVKALCDEAGESTVGKDDKSAQLAVVNKSIRGLEKQRVPIPEEFRRLRAQLAVDLSATAEYTHVLNSAMQSLEETLEMIQVKLPKRTRGRATNRLKLPRSTRKRDDGSHVVHVSSTASFGAAMEEAIVVALKSLGGAARRSEIIDWIEAHKQVLPEEYRSKSRSSMESNAINARSRLVMQRIMRGDTPYGQWELAGRGK